MKPYKSLIALLFLINNLLYASDRQNVLMIVLDDLNDYIGVMDGHPQAKTPHLDQLAKEGVLFENAHSNASVCAPSRSSFMTGILPSTSRNYGFDKWYQNPVLKNCKTIAQLTRENGYRAYRSGKVLHHKSPKEWTGVGENGYQGPVAYNGIKPVGHPSVPEEFINIGLLDGSFAPLSDVPSVPASGDAPGYTGWWDSQKGKPFKYNSPTDRDLMSDEKSAKWLKKTLTALEDNKEDDSPFFIAVGIVKPHTPHIVPKKFYDMYPLESLKIPVIKEGDNEDCKYDEVLEGKGRTHFAALTEAYTPIEEGIRAYLQGYLASVSFADHIIGQVMRALDESKFKDNTTVILFSDHGYNMGEKDYLFKNSLWEESTHVPFIIRHPDYMHQAGKSVEHPISLIDVYPTIVDLCDFKGDNKKNENGADLDGYSLKPFLDNPETNKWEGPKTALTVIANRGEKNPAMQNYSLRSRDYRYIRYANGSEELYDHTIDSYEWTNVENDEAYAKIKTKLSKALDRQIEQFKQ